MRVFTPAKVNLFLRVLGKRADGYHELETLFQAIDLEDELIIRKTRGASSLEVPDYPDLETDSNLVVRALRWLEHETGRDLSVAMRLIKRIPLGGGLGGGSSNAAGALVGIRDLCELDLTRDDLLKGALALGADVPFFLLGGTAVGEGVGERLTPVKIPMDYGLVLVNPGYPVSTKAIFHRLSKTLTVKAGEGRLGSVLGRFSGIDRLLWNDLQPVAEEMHPEISQIRDALEMAGAAKVLMTGSGPTVFGIAEPDRIHEIVQTHAEEMELSHRSPVDQGSTCSLTGAVVFGKHRHCWGVVKWQDTGLWNPHSEVRILPPQPSHLIAIRRDVAEGSA